MNVLLGFVLATAFVGSAAGFAQAPDACATAPQSCATLITTRASSHTRVANSAVDVSVGILATDKDLPSVQRSLGTKSGTLLSYLRGQQVQRLITTEVSFAPQVKTDKNNPDKMVGYTGSLKVSFRTTPEKAPDLLSGVLSNGANTIDSTVFTPTEEDTEAARRELAAAATRTAVSQAEAIAKAAGMHVVSVRQINVENESGIYPRPMNLYARSAMKAEAGAVPAIETAAGEQEISVGVNLVAAAIR